MEISNIFEVEIKKWGKTVAHTGCVFSDGVVRIKDLYVREMFRNRGLNDILLMKVQEYADKKKADKIITYCGPEPFCEDGQVPVEQEVEWYQSHGFVHDHSLFGLVPCMVKTL